jgi:hypothetical protein
MTVEFSPFVFNIYRRNKQKKTNRSDERVTCERPVKCPHGCSDGHMLARMKKRKEHVMTKEKKK